MNDMCNDVGDVDIGEEEEILLKIYLYDIKIEIFFFVIQISFNEITL